MTTRILHRSYYRNDFIFVRPAVSTEYIENDEPAALPTYRAYYPTRDKLRATWLRIVTNFQLDRAFEDLERDVDSVLAAVDERLGDIRMRANFQIQVLSSLFFRNKGAYIVGKVVNGFVQTPFALAIVHTESGALAIDTALFGEDQLELVFSFARAYFMVNMEVPSAYVAFLRSLMPRKPPSEIYSALGLQKQGKSLFYRDFLAHMRHSSDDFRIAPGIKGMVMLVFDLPSFPVRLQDHQGLLSGAQGDDAGADPEQVPAGQAARPGRAHGRHARIQQRRLPAQPLRRGACSPSCATSARACSTSRATPSSSDTSTSSVA